VAQSNKKALVVVSLFVVGIMILGLFMALKSDLPKLGATFQHIHIQFLVFALLCTAIAYLAFTLSFNGLFELTPVSDELKDAIARGAPRADLRVLAARVGMRPLAADGWNKARAGITTVEEVLRVVQH